MSAAPANRTTYRDALREAIRDALRRDPRVFLIGEDVAEAGHPFKTLVGLVQEFGTDRIIDTPISEPGYAGIGVGAAMTGSAIRRRLATSSVTAIAPGSRKTTVVRVPRSGTNNATSSGPIAKPRLPPIVNTATPLALRAPASWFATRAASG